MAQSIQREPAFLRRKQVETRTGLSRSTIYQYIKDGVFPKPVPLGPRATSFRPRENHRGLRREFHDSTHGLLTQLVPNAPTTAVLIQMTTLDQIAEMPL